MTKDQLINEFLKQNIKAKSSVEITLKGDAVFTGELTDAKIKSPDEHSEYHLIGLILTPPKGKIMSKAPQSIAVEMIVSILKF